METRPSAKELARQFQAGESTALSIIQACLNRIDSCNPRLNCFTTVFRDDALAEAVEMDRRRRSGSQLGPLAGVPFGVKDLFDVAGRPTTAGAKMRLRSAPATRDAEVVARMKRNGAILVGTLNMDEYAYGFATDNAHFGPTHNPHDIDRLAGGSSGGSAAAVAAGLVPLSLGSDTNGSIRVPAGLCGIWGIRPAEGVIPLSGVFPFVEILDTAGPFSLSCGELLLAYNAIADQPIIPDPVALEQPIRVAKLDGWFERNASDDAREAVEIVMQALGTKQVASMPESEAARSASFLITAAQGGALHFESLKTKAMDYDPAVRDRLFAGTMLPASAYLKAMSFRSYYRTRIAEVFDRFDIILSAVTPVVAPRIDESTVMIDGKPMPARAQLGIYTQPLSLSGIPMVSAPVYRPGKLPMGVQFATMPGREPMLFHLLMRLEDQGVLRSAPIESV
jgi:AtzE family amidohydrolase